MGARRITCIFCGEQRSSSNEHVIAKWMRKSLALMPDGATEVNSKTVHQWRHLNVMLDHKICGICNNGWLSALEESVSPFVSVMLTHRGSIDLDRRQQRDLARWAVIKVLLMELAMRQNYQRQRTALGYEPTEAELAWLGTNLDPPPRSRVWLGAFDAEQSIASSSRARLLGSTASQTGKSVVRAHVTTVTFGYMLLQIFTTDFVAADSLGLPQFDLDVAEPFDQAMTRIWPAAPATVHWPRGVFVDQAALPAVVAGHL